MRAAVGNEMRAGPLSLKVMTLGVVAKPLGWRLNMKLQRPFLAYSGIVACVYPLKETVHRELWNETREKNRIQRVSGYDAVGGDSEGSSN